MWNVIFDLTLVNENITSLIWSIVATVLDNTMSTADMHEGGGGFVDEFDESKFNLTHFGNITDLDQFACQLLHHGIEVSETLVQFLT